MELFEQDRRNGGEKVMMTEKDIDVIKNKYDYLNRDICTFSSYISTSIENAILLELRKYNKHSHVLSFEQPLGQSKDGDELTIDDIIGTDEEALLEEVVSDIKNDILRRALESLTSKRLPILNFFQFSTSKVKELSCLFWVVIGL